ncbi:TauD/TfdA family dioxygenase [Paraburkholderia caffeinilytica]|uniref:TauD/TfdA family dioxygenase n=1 Tax=Paraburkholderia caffeinilytica TaxID=1761016 RepID=UPI003DA0BA18
MSIESTQATAAGGRPNRAGQNPTIRPVVCRADWRPKTLQTDDWCIDLTALQAAEVRQALAHVRQTGKSFDDLTSADFPLPTLASILAGLREQLENGIGFRLVRNFPTDGLGKEDLRMIFWGLGKHLGTAVTQSARGDLIGDVRDLHLNAASGKMRAYTSNLSQSFHTDSCDVAALFVLRQGISGGDSHVVSAVAIHNEMLRVRPDLVETLYQPFYWSWQDQEAPGELPYYQQPVFCVHDGIFACRVIGAHIHSAQAFPEVPRLTPAQVEALDMIQALSASPEFQMTFRMCPGDLEILNNHVVLHGRTRFEDGTTEETTRHLLRMWLSVPDSRALSPLMGTIYRDLTPGVVRGGFPSRSNTYMYETKVMTD